MIYQWKAKNLFKLLSKKWLVHRARLDIDLDQDLDVDLGLDLDLDLDLD